MFSHDIIFKKDPSKPQTPLFLKPKLTFQPDPIIFRPLKSLTQSNTQQNSLLRLAQEGISVYSPHTAVDAAPGGLCDFLADITVGFDR